MERNNCATVPCDRYSLAMKNGQRVGHVPKIAQNLFLRPQWQRVSTPAAEMSMSMVVTKVHSPFPHGWLLMYCYSNVFEPKRFAV